MTIELVVPHTHETFENYVRYHERNVLEGILNNWMFCAIWLSCVFIQLLLVEASALGDCKSTKQWGLDMPFMATHLTGEQWGIL
jgi:hypothetical protein